MTSHLDSKDGLPQTVPLTTYLDALKLLDKTESICLLQEKIIERLKIQIARLLNAPLHANSADSAQAVGTGPSNSDAPAPLS